MQTFYFPWNYPSILRFPNATSYIHLIQIRVMVCSSIRVIFEMRAWRYTARVMKIDHRIVLLFEQALPAGIALLPYFPMLQFTGNESNTKIQYVLRVPVSRRAALKVCVSF